MEGRDSSPFCEQCEQFFETEPELRAHRARVHQEEVLLRTSTGNVIKVAREKESKVFLCPGECGYFSEVPRNLQRHAKLCRSLEKEAQIKSVECTAAENEAEKTPIELAPGPNEQSKSSLISSAVLEPFQIKVSTLLGRPICGSCGVALEVGSCNTHLRSTHSRTNIPVDIDVEVTKLLKAKDIKVDIKELLFQTIQPREAVEGLKVYRNAWKCLHCASLGVGYFVPQKDSIMRHLRREHSRRDTLEEGTEQGVERCEAVQTIFGGTRRKYFAVFAPPLIEFNEPHRTLKKIVAQLEHSNTQSAPVKNQLDPANPQIPRTIGDCTSRFETAESENVIDTILAETRWHQILLNYPMQRIKLYIAGPGRRDILEQKIGELVYMYLKIGTNRLQYNTSLHLRRKLMGEKGTSFRYFSGLQTTKSLQQYAESICRLVLMCIRRARKPNRMEENFIFEDFPAIPADLVELSLLFLSEIEGVSITGRQGLLSSSDMEKNLSGILFETKNEILNKELLLLHQIIRSIFCVKFPISEKRERMVIHQYLAFISKLDDERFIRAEEIPPIVSRLLYTCRIAVMFQVALEESKGSGTNQALAWLDFVKSEEFTPFVELSEVFGLATNVSNSSLTLPEIIWDTSCPNGTQLFIQGIGVSIQSLSQFLRNILEQSQRMLYKNILLSDASSRRPINKDIELLRSSLLRGNIQDDLRFEGKGYYFGEDARNRRCVSELSASFLRDILLDPSRRGEFFTTAMENGREIISWSTERMVSFLNLCENLVNLLIPIFQIISGQPARCTELSTTQIRNSATSRRSLMVINKRLVNILSYSKTRSMTGRPRLVPRFLDEEASSLLTVYLVVVRPVEVFFMRKLLGDERANDHATYLFSTMEGRIEGREVAKTFDRLLRASWLPLTSRMYRHVCTAFTRELLRGKSTKNQVWLPYDEQAAHSAETAEFRYGRSISDHRNLTSHELVAYYAASVSWQQLLGFSSEELLKSPEIPSSNADGENKFTSAITSARNLGASSPVIEGALLRLDEGLQAIKADMQLMKEKYLILAATGSVVQKNNRPDPALKNDFERTGIHFSSPKRAKDNWRKEKQAGGNAEQLNLAIASNWNGLPALERTILYRTCLQNLLNNPSADFRSTEQLLAIHQVWCRSRDVVAVLPTGAGKSMLFLVPCLLERDLVTVIVCPLIALSHDMGKRLARAGLKFAVWSERHSGDFQALIVSIETASTSEFLQFLEQLALQKGLARVVLDEAHVILTSADYRPRLRELFAFRPSAPVPLLLLTASLPPSMTEDLCRAVGSRNPLIIRSPSTVRVNIKYSLRRGSRIGTQARFKTLVAILKHQMAQFSRHDRALVYCLRKSTTELLARRLTEENEGLRAMSYHSETCEKKLLDESWRLGHARVMVATSAFGAGIDYPHVRLVIHNGEPRTLMDFAQESGRAGRDGKKAESIILLQPPLAPAPGASKRSIEEMYRREDPEVRSWIAACGQGNCIRQTLHAYLDKCAVPCIGLSQSQAQLCGVCEKAIRKGNSSTEVPISEEYLNVKCKKMSISSSLALECKQADAERRNIKEALERFNEMCNRLKRRECPHCMGATGKRSNTPSVSHSPGRCPYMQKRCLRCYSTTHASSSQCPCPPFSFPEREGKCYQCGFRMEYFGEPMHEKNYFGRQCTSGARFAREVLLSFWAYRKENLSREISEFELLKGDIMKFQLWLYDTSSRLPNIIGLFNKIYLSDDASKNII